MTTEEARRLYLAAGGDRHHEAEQWEAIREEMEAVVAARSLGEAAGVIHYWDCWHFRGEPAASFARRVRQQARARRA